MVTMYAPGKLVKEDDFKTTDCHFRNQFWPCIKGTLLHSLASPFFDVVRKPAFSLRLFIVDLEDLEVI